MSGNRKEGRNQELERTKIGKIRNEESQEKGVRWEGQNMKEEGGRTMADGRKNKERE